MIKKVISWFLKPTKRKIICYDNNYFSPGDKIFEFEERIKLLEDQVKVLQEENVQTTNSLYEIANSLDARIDILLNTPKHYENFN